jgi:hypothetical protein
LDVPLYLFFSPDEIGCYSPDTGSFMTFLEETLGVTGTVTRLGVTESVIRELGLYAHRVSLSYPYTADYADGAFLPGELMVSHRTEEGTRYVASLLTDMVLEVDAAVFDYLDEDLGYFVDDTLQTAAIANVKSMQFIWQFGGEGSLLAGSYTFDIILGIKENAKGDTYETVTGVKVTGPDGQVIDLENYKSFNQLFYRLGYGRYTGTHDLTEEELANLFSDEKNCALSLQYLMRDGTLSYLEFYPITENTVVVRSKNLTDGRVGAAFTVYGTTLRDIARGFIAVMEGKELDHAERYE